MRYPLSLYSAVCHLHLHKTGKKNLINESFQNHGVAFDKTPGDFTFTCLGLISFVLNSHTCCFFPLVFFFFLGLHSWHMEFPRLGVKSELWPLAYATATATPDPSRVCDVHHGPWQRWILNPLSEARDPIAFTWIHVGFVNY